MILLLIALNSTDLGHKWPFLDGENSGVFLVIFINTRKNPADDPIYGHPIKKPSPFMAKGFLNNRDSLGIIPRDPPTYFGGMRIPPSNRITSAFM